MKKKQQQTNQTNQQTIETKAMCQTEKDKQNDHT